MTKQELVAEVRRLRKECAERRDECVELRRMLAGVLEGPCDHGEEPNGPEVLYELPCDCPVCAATQRRPARIPS